MTKPLHHHSNDFPLSGPRAVLNRTFDVPDTKRDITKLINVNWLIRNIRVRNPTHEKIDATIEMLKEQFRALRKRG